MAAATMLKMSVVVSGIKNSLPKTLKRKSPGSLPKPRRCSQGVKPLINTRARKTTISQRNMFFAPCLQGVRFVAGLEPERLPGLALVKTDDLEEFAHFMLHDQFLRHHAGWQVGGFHVA